MDTTTTPTATLTATFSSIQSQTFEARCVGCHGIIMNAGLDLRATTGDPEASYLIHKLEGRAGIVGSRMPQGGPFLSTDEIDVIRSWIMADATND